MTVSAMVVDAVVPPEVPVIVTVTGPPLTAEPPAVSVSKLPPLVGLGVKPAVTPVGKPVNGTDAPFRDIPNGVPGLGSRLPILFSEGVSKGRIDPCTFVRLTSANPARLFGLYPRKGTIAPGADADLVLWDAGKSVTITNDLLQHIIDYTPYEGMQVTGWPVCTIRRGDVVMQDGIVQAEPGSGQFLARGPYDLIKPTGNVPFGFDASAFLV